MLLSYHSSDHYYYHDYNSRAPPPQRQQLQPLLLPLLLLLRRRTSYMLWVPKILDESVLVAGLASSDSSQVTVPLTWIPMVRASREHAAAVATCCRAHLASAFAL